MVKSVAIAIALCVAFLLAIFLLRGSPVDSPSGSPQPVVGAPADSAPGPTESSPVQASGGAGSQLELRFERPRHYDAFDFNSILKRSLRDAARGSEQAQYRASVMLRDCPSRRTVTETDAEFEVKGLEDDSIAVIRDRARRCDGVLDLISGDPFTASRELREATLEQDFPIAVADQLIVERDWMPPAIPDGNRVDGQEFEARPLPADEVDARLLAALEAAGSDRVLRYEAFFLVLGAMDGRSSANRMQAEPVVMHAWTVLHCRESWECDLEATLDHLLLQMPASTLKLAVNLAREIESALERRDFSMIRLH